MLAKIKNWLVKILKEHSLLQFFTLLFKKLKKNQSVFAESAALSLGSCKAQYSQAARSAVEDELVIM